MILCCIAIHVTDIHFRGGCADRAWWFAHLFSAAWKC